MSDLQKRLRKGQRIDSWGFHTPTRLDKEAAEEIERLKARVDELESACVHWKVAESIWDKDAVDRLQARVDELEAEVKLWRDNEQNCLDALNRIDELKSLLKGDDL